MISLPLENRNNHDPNPTGYHLKYDFSLRNCPAPLLTVTAFLGDLNIPDFKSKLHTCKYNW